MKTSSYPVALVTGAASTLGSAISLKLAEKGMRLVLHYGKSREKTVQLKKKLEQRGVETILLKADLSKQDQVKPMIQQLLRQWGRLDVLVNNASFFKPTPLAKGYGKEWENIFQINTVSPCVLAMAVKSLLQRTKGCVVNITDIYGELPVLKDYPAYSASKAALLFLTKYLAVELAPDIRVNAVSPGVISFPEKYSSSKRRKLIERSVLKRAGTPREIADAVWFLASNPFITGQVLKVDGGRFIS